MALFLRLVKGSCVLAVGCLFIGLTQIIKAQLAASAEIEQLSKDFDPQTGLFDPAIVLLEKQVETLFYSLEASLSELEQLSKDFDSQTDPAIVLLEKQVETLCHSLEASLSELEQLSKDFDSQTGLFDPAIVLLEKQVETLCHSLEAILFEIWIPDTLKNLSRTKIDALRHALAQEDYDQIKTDSLILRSILYEIDGLYEALGRDDTVKSDLSRLD
jgi:hypothetical protein